MDHTKTDVLFIANHSSMAGDNDVDTRPIQAYTYSHPLPMGGWGTKENCDDR